MRLEATSGGGGYRAVGADFPVNLGTLCIKGVNAPALLGRPERLRTPLLRRASGELAEVSWDVALDKAAEMFLEVERRHGDEALGVFGSGALTNEVAYLLGKFARLVFHTPNIDYNGRFCMSSAASALNRSLGLDRGLPFPVSDLEQAECILCWGTNWSETLPPISQWFERQRNAGGYLINIDPRRTATSRAADLSLLPVPGTDLALANGLLFIAIEEDLIDQSYIEARTTGFDAVRSAVMSYWPGRVEAITGIAEDDMRQVVRRMASAQSSVLLSGRGPEQQSKGVDTVTAFINLMLALGKIGKPCSGYGTLTGQGNGQGGRELGQKADQLPGYRSITDAADREHIAAVWGVPPERLPGRGRSAVELLTSIGTPGGIRAFLVMGSNLAVAAPDAGHVRQKLRALDALVVVDAFHTETTEAADVVFPSLQWAEDSGTMTNLEGRLLLREVVVPPPVGPRSDLHILQALAARMGRSRGFEFASSEAVFEELRQATRGGRSDYSAITYDRLRQGEELFWPCGETSPRGTARVYQDRFHHPDGRARFVAVEHRAAGETPDEEYPWYCTTGRYREHYNSGAQTRRLPRLVEAHGEPLAEVHPALLERLGLLKASHVRLRSRRGAAVFRVNPTRDIRRDTVFVPFHWGGFGSANLLAGSALDPLSRMPEFKLCAVAVEPVDTPVVGLRAGE